MVSKAMRRASDFWNFAALELATIAVILPVMTSLLELPALRNLIHRMSVSDYHRAGEAGALSKDVELLRGIVVNKMAKSPFHGFVAQKLMKLLLGKAPEEFEVRVEKPLTFVDSEPEPDISVVKGSAEDWLPAHPATAHLVIEVS